MLDFLNKIFYQSLGISGGKSPFKKGNLKTSPNLVDTHGQARGTFQKTSFA